MKTIFRLLPLMMLIIMACPDSVYAAGDVAEFNVATYNIRQKNESDSLNGDNWKQRCPMVAGIIRFHEFNIFGTQEGFKDQLEELKAQLPGYEYIGVAREDGKDAGEHSAIFYDTDMFELIDHGDFWLSLRHPTVRAWDGMPRVYAYVHGENSATRIQARCFSSSISISIMWGKRPAWRACCSCNAR